MNDRTAANELTMIARELSAATDWDHPGMPEALKVLAAASPGLLKWLNDNTRLEWTAVYSAGSNKSSSLAFGLGAVQTFNAKEDRMRGGGWWRLEVYANVEGETATTSTPPGDRTFTDARMKWDDLKNPAKIFGQSRLPK